MAKFYDQPHTCLIWFGLFVYGVSALLYAASRAYIEEENDCFNNTEVYDMKIPDCAPLWAHIIGMAGFFIAVFLSSMCCMNKMKICPLLSVILFAGAGLMGIFYLYDVSDDVLFDNMTDEAKAFTAAPGAYVFLTSVRMNLLRRA